MKRRPKHRRPPLSQEAHLEHQRIRRAVGRQRSQENTAGLSQNDLAAQWLRANDPRERAAR